MATNRDRYQNRQTNANEIAQEDLDLYAYYSLPPLAPESSTNNKPLCQIEQPITNNEITKATKVTLDANAIYSKSNKDGIAPIPVLCDETIKQLLEKGIIKKNNYPKQDLNLQAAKQFTISQRKRNKEKLLSLKRSRLSSPNDSGIRADTLTQSDLQANILQNTSNYTTDSSLKNQNQNVDLISNDTNNDLLQEDNNNKKTTTTLCQPKLFRLC